MLRLLVLAVACRKPRAESSAPAPTPESGPTETAGTETVPNETGPTDTDTDTPPPLTRVLDADHLLVVPSEEALELVDDAFGTVAAFEPVDLAAEACAAGCYLEGGSDDGSWFLQTFVQGGFSFRGGVVAVDRAGTIGFVLEGFDFPHDVVRDPLDGSLIVCEPFVGLTWVDGSGTSAEPLRSITNDHPDWPAETPNGMDLLVFEGRSLLLVSHRGVPFGLGPSGAIVLWDITDPDAPLRVWVYPDGRALDTVHGAVLRQVGGPEGSWVLGYAHTGGSAGSGTVGVAVTEDPTVLPSYVADLEPTRAWVFLRGVEITEDARVYATDAGAEFAGGEPAGTLSTLALPELTPSGLSGGAPDDQVFLPADEEVVRVRLTTPFEARLTTREAPSADTGG